MNLSSTNTKQIGDCLMGIKSSIKKLSNLYDLFFNKLRAPISFTGIRFAKMFKGMMFIFIWRNPLKVCLRVVEFIAVLVIAPRSIWPFPVKCRTRKVMNIKTLSAIEFPQGNLEISIFEPTHAQVANPSTLVGFYAFYISEIANLIKAFISNYVFPDFLRHIYYSINKLVNFWPQSLSRRYGELTSKMIISWLWKIAAMNASPRQLYYIIG